jgi:methionyl-tRNA formyltransferase
MIPIDIKAKTINLPENDNHHIVIITANGLKHKCFALKIQKHFPDLVIAYYELDSSIVVNGKENEVENQLKTSKSRNIKQDLLSYYEVFGIKNTIIKIFTEIKSKLIERKYNKIKSDSEKNIFSSEYDMLKKYRSLEPIKIHPSEINSLEIIAAIKECDPYFILTLGGPLYSEALFNAAKGLTINQHAGHSPLYKGTRTTEWALYNRKLKYVSNTVHITASGADSGAILRRSNPCIFPSDNYGDIINRVVALGTELMIEVVEDIIKNKKITVFEQNKYEGETFLSKDLNIKKTKFIFNDFKNNWLQTELESNRNY